MALIKKSSIRASLFYQGILLAFSTPEAIPSFTSKRRKIRLVFLPDATDYINEETHLSSPKHYQTRKYQIKVEVAKDKHNCTL